jgi:hypothetical protein
MADFDVTSIMNALAGGVASLGRYERVISHEPRAAPNARGDLTCALIVMSMRPVSQISGLATVSYRLEVLARSFASYTADPLDSIDISVINAAVALCAALTGGFELGGLVEQVDVFGAYGDQLSITTGQVEQNSKLFRVADLIIPLILADIQNEVP